MYHFHAAPASMIRLFTSTFRISAIEAEAEIAVFTPDYLVVDFTVKAFRAVGFIAAKNVHARRNMKAIAASSFMALVAFVVAFFAGFL